MLLHLFCPFEAFIQTLLIQLKMYSLFWSDTRSKLDNPFRIKDFVSICQNLIFFKVILPLFYTCGRIELFLKKLKIEINFGWYVTLKWNNVWERRWCKFHISWLYLGVSFFQLGLLLGISILRNVYFLLVIQYLLNIQYSIFGLH